MTSGTVSRDQEVVGSFFDSYEVLYVMHFFGIIPKTYTFIYKKIRKELFAPPYLATLPPQYFERVFGVLPAQFNQ
jgi:hypothetical protein